MNTILEMRGITKTFPGVKALDNVNLAIRDGEIHALVGENGAGKSTLMKVLSGVHPHGSYDGDILFDGEIRSFKSIADSERLGIIIIHQELALVPLLSIAENIYLGNEQAQKGVIDWPRSYAQTEKLLAKVGLSEAPGTPVGELGVGKQQLVEIAKALSKNVRLLILDEPTASLNEAESAALLELLKEFRAQGITSILISHKLNEVKQVADTVTVLRDGATVSRLDCSTETISEDRIVADMVGRSLSDRFPPRTPNIGDIVFKVRDWNVFHPQQSDRQIIRNVSLDVRAGEIVGIAGLMGSGRTELAMSIFGRSYGQKISGEVTLHDQPMDVSSVQRAVGSGLAYATEDRKTYGLVLDDTISRNVSMANLGAVSRAAIMDDHYEDSVAEGYRHKINIKTPHVQQKAVNLSGGNQQKVVLSKWLFTDPEVLILDEPTRGIDVGAKYEIYSLINELAAQHKAIIVISSEMPELLGISDRIYVMNEGELIGELPREQASQETIMTMIIQSGRH
ncbi:multiple monosaccharide ABC transporter ATP-binding protein [Saccharospirillum sp. MSK14-1]|uniref:multiple monosaccharide ABC transporter ATP-binding protein n=1 Tax=Saccharospirillum sp. MSK14-1 TaxID=1897632 RepID=UPI00268F1641|nr:multiple monosaccharide ABC transporter ATP-binding protein [Saccharospirillum sp. MSK14-1]